jgi:uncharacterized protein YndB with AHSA1/START domain
MTHQATPVVAALQREVRVPCDLDTAFRLFTSHIGAWWPLATHGVLGEAASVAFEGDRLVERLGTEVAVWGEVLEHDPPYGFRMTWHPGHGPERATEVSVAFAPDGDDATVVTLTHTGWERLATPEATRENYAGGWTYVLGQFAAGVVRPSV